MYIDWTYIALVLPAVIFSLLASRSVSITFKKYASVYTISKITGYDTARMVLDANGLYSVRIQRISGNLTDHFNPRTNVISLSDHVYNNTSAAAIGVAAHEAGHAAQYAKGYIPIKIRTAIVPLTNFGSKTSMPLILIGLLFSTFSPHLAIIAYIGVAFFALSTLFQLITLPTEFNASSHAMTEIKRCGMFTAEEIVSFKKVLSAAAMTYVASLAVSFMELMQLVLSIKNRARTKQ